MLLHTFFRSGWSSVSISFVVIWFFVDTGAALSMNIVSGIPFTSIVRTWIFTSMTVGGPVVRHNSFLFHEEIIFFCDHGKLRTVHVHLLSDCEGCKVSTFLSMYRLYLAFRSVKAGESF